MKLLIPLIVGVFIVAYFFGSFLGSNTVYINQTPLPEIIYKSVMDSGISSASINAPAVDEDGNGVVTTINVQSMAGTGRTLTNIDKLFFWVDTQDSIRTARSVAEDMTGMNLSNYDLTYTIIANASVIEGPSAGASLTIATIAALENKTINPSVMITGTIESNGRVGSVGEIEEKARSAKENGARVFLIPKGYISKKTGYEKHKTCKTEDGTEYCETEYMPKDFELSRELGITIKEVENIGEVLEYFI